MKRWRRPALEQAMSEAPGSVITQRVLIVEDDPVIRLLACEALAEIGMTPV